ncbi:MAG: FtsQ-type POTRA domain-containing protein [Acidobacteria bacterium]|nr:FtsQ-type POTRA domain-containing protein [Acidobacteriota bacterium]
MIRRPSDGGRSRDESAARVVSSQRLNARRRAVRAAMIRRRRRTALVLALALSVSVGGWAFARSSFFALSRIEVAGVRALTAGDVIAASGLRVGQNVLGLDRTAIAARVRAMPLVRGAAVERVGPSTLRIEVVERTPALEVLASGENYWVDEDGRRFDGRPAAGVLVPIYRVPPARPVPADRSPDRLAGAASHAGSASHATGAPSAAVRRPAPGRATVQAVLTVWRRLPPSMTREIRWFETGPGGILLLRLGAIEVILGSPDRIAEKAAAVEMVVGYSRAEGKRVRRIDVRAPRHPAASVG